MIIPWSMVCIYADMAVQVPKILLLTIGSEAKRNSHMMNETRPAIPAMMGIKTRKEDLEEKQWSVLKDHWCQQFIHTIQTLRHL